MEDIIAALLDVVRAQHTATEGTDEEPFNMDDVVDMAMNIIGRPDEPEELDQLVHKIEDTVSSMAPDIFPPKTLEELDGSEQAASVANMIEQSRLNSTVSSPESGGDVESDQLIDAYRRAEGEEDESEEEFSAQDAANLNDLIYQNVMQMMGMNEPQVEYPFDRSQIRYGREKSITEQLAEEEAGQKEEARPLSAWELAQSVIDADIEAHTKEEYVPKPMEMPDTKSASQLAAEAIAQSREEDRMKTEIEKRAEAMMEEARRLGKDPMAFALHQQEILQYMEKNSDELVSFEDYEDLSPEEKLEIERAMEEERARENMESGQPAFEAAAEEAAASPGTPAAAEEEIAEETEGEGPVQTAPDPEEPAGESTGSPEPESDPVEETAETSFGGSSSEETPGEPEPEEEPVETGSDQAAPEIDEELLRQLSREVLEANSSEILAENGSEDLESLNQEIMNNIRTMMQNAKTEVVQEDVETLLEQAAARAAAPESPDQSEGDGGENAGGGLSAADLARAAQRAAGIKQPEEPVQTKSAVEIAKEAQEEARRKKEAENKDPIQEALDLDMDDFEFDVEEDSESAEAEKEEARPEPAEEAQADETGAEPAEEARTEEAVGEESDQAQPETEDKEPAQDQADAKEETMEEYVLGMHTQAEVDEALENLLTLGLEGEVYDRAKRLLLLELAGSEAELDAWLEAQKDKEEKKKEASALDQEEEITDLSDLEGMDLEAELDEALEEEFEVQPEEPVEEVQEEAEETTESDDGPAEDAAAAAEAETEDTVTEDVAEAVEAEAEPEEESRTEDKAEEKEYQVSVRTPFVLKNSSNYMDKFKDYIVDTQENRKLSTGFRRLDAMLRYGLHKGTYFIDSSPQHLKNIFMQQIADHAAEGGVDVLYISTELSRYDLMVETISRLSYEINGKDPEKAVSAMAIMTGEAGADLDSLEDELNWYRGRISEHLFIFDQESVEEFLDDTEDVSAGVILEELIRSIVTEDAHKPVVFIDNIENILSVSDSEDMKPLMEGIGKLARELGIPILLSYGYAPKENEYELYPEEKELHSSLGHMCDVYLELSYADTITEDYKGMQPEDAQMMSEEGETLLVDINLIKNRRTTRAGCQIQATPKFNHFEE